MRLRPGWPVFWRGDSTVQIGFEPGQALILEPISDNEYQLLDLLVSGAPRNYLARRAKALGIPKPRFEDILAQLHSAGLLEEANNQYSDWGLETGLCAAGAHADSELRTKASIFVAGPARINALLVPLLAEFGIGFISILGTDAVADVSQFTQLELRLSQLRSQYPLTQFEVTGSDTWLHTRTPQLTVMTYAYVPPAQLWAQLRGEQLPHLPVRLGAGLVEIGPLVEVNHGPCLRCVNEGRCASDPAWPTVLAQTWGLQPPPTEPALLRVVTGQVAQLAVAYCCGKAPLAGLSLTYQTGIPLPWVKNWSAQPSCGCQSLADVYG